MQNIMLLSNSEIKKTAIFSVYSDETKYNITCVEVPDNINREPQPIGIIGTQKACSERFDEFFKLNYEIKNNTKIISIENGLAQLEDKWCDICIIGIMDYETKNIIFNLSPLSIIINKEHTSDYFQNYYKKNIACDTFGKYIQLKFGVPHNNWMKYISNIDRIDQIKLGVCVSF